MPLRIIPNKLHFIWVGPELPAEHAVNLLTWVTGNPHYKVYLWTEDQLVASTAEMLLQTYTDIFNLPKVTSRFIETYQGILLKIKRNFRSSVEININSIGTIPPIIDPLYIYEELSTWKNYGSVSDILRIGVVYHMGGIYMDMDTYPELGPLPRNIYAPWGVLLCEHVEGDCTRLITPIIASSAGNKRLLPVAADLQTRYEQDYILIAPGIHKVRSAHIQRLEDLIALRASVERGEIDHHDKKIRYHELLVKPTLTRCGGIFNTLMAELPDNFSLSELSFQQRALYFPGIGNDSMWVR